ncbi:uncharacterized protein LOC115211934 [Octopus sinensis]|uniref:Uncharacterized protein LOC115211934 n=1 Tax=Octopus sinensis TaxID=2607531 RepID=A0A6P7SEE0_9MOLL|nr:uncharacterized protein LOC115211934 [Octopus sinensis]XP_036359319.1 uncharacterized protein LOC115211934 [Octopus sinensis]
MGQLTKEETKTETRKLPEERTLERDQQFLSGEEANLSEEEEQPKEYKAQNSLTVGSESDVLERNFSNLTISDGSMKSVELASAGEESESDEETDDDLDKGESLKRGPTNGVPVSLLRTHEAYFASSQDPVFTENKSKRSYDSHDVPYYKYQRPVYKSCELNESWLSSSFPVTNGGIISVNGENYESDSAQSAPYTISECSRSPDQNDSQNDLAILNQENTLDDLMAILQEDNNKNMYPNLCKEDFSSSKISHIKNIKETLKNGFEKSTPNNIPETFNIEDQYNKASPPPQCVPQLLDQHCPNFEMNETLNVNITEQENLNRMAAIYERMPGLKNCGPSSMDKKLQEQFLLNSLKQNDTLDGCSILNAPPYMGQQFIDGNLLNICSQGQITMNEGNQSRPVTNSGSERKPVMNIGPDKRTTIMGSDHQLQGLHNYDQKPIMINGSAGQQQPINGSGQRVNRVSPICQGVTEMNVGRPNQNVMNTRNTAATMISAGNQGRIMMNLSSQNQVIMNAGIQSQAIMNAGSPGQTIANAGSPGHSIANVGSPGQPIMNAGSPGQTLVNAGSPHQTIMNAGSPHQTIMNAGSPHQTIMNAGSPHQTIMNAGSPHQTIMNAGSPHQTIMNAGSPSQTIINAGSPGQTLVNAGSPGQTIMNAGSPVNAGSPGQTIINAGSPGQTIVNAGSPHQNIINAGSPNQTILSADSPSQTILNDDEQEQIIMNATSQAQTVTMRQTWMNSLDGGQNLPSVSVPCTVNPNKSPLIYSPVAELVGQGGQVYSSQSPHVIINGTTSNLQNPAIVTQAIPNQTTTPGTLTSTAVSSTPLLVLNTPPLYIMSPTSNALILVQKPPTPTTKSSPKPILPKPPASDIKPHLSDEHVFPKHFNTAKKGKAVFNPDANAVKSGASHQIIARRCVASRTDEELLAIDSDGNNYLHAAVCVTDVNMVKALLERIKRIKKIEIINDCNSLNQTPLYLAVFYNKPAVVCELVRNGANPNIPGEKRRSALHCAATQGKEFNLTLKQLFESKKIDPNIKNCDGLTPLLCAIMEHGKIVSRNNKNVMIDNCVNVSLLLKNGADPEVYDGRNGMTPLMHAIERKDINLIEAIVKHVDPAKFQKMLSARTFSERTCSMIAEELQNKFDPSVYRKLTSILSLNK